MNWKFASTVFCISVAMACDVVPPDRDSIVDEDSEQDILDAIPNTDVTTSPPTTAEVDLVLSQLTIASVWNGTNLRIWTPNAEDDRFYTDSADNLISVAFSPDGEFVAIGSNQGAISVLRTSDAASVQDFTGFSSVLDVEWSPDGSLLAACTFDQKIRVWDRSNWELLGSKHVNTVCRSISWNFDSSSILSGDTDGSTLFSNVVEYAWPGFTVLTPSYFLSEWSSVEFVLFSKTGINALIYGYKTTPVATLKSIYSTGSWTSLTSFSEPELDLTAGDWLSDDSAVIVGGSSGGISMISSADGSVVKRYSIEQSEISFIKLVDNDSFFVFGSTNGVVYLVDVTSGTGVFYESNQGATLDGDVYFNAE